MAIDAKNLPRTDAEGGPNKHQSLDAENERVSAKIKVSVGQHFDGEISMSSTGKQTNHTILIFGGISIAVLLTIIFTLIYLSN